MKMMGMNIFLVLIASFTQIYAYIESETLCLLEDSNNQCCVEAIEKMQRFLNTSGMITFSKNKFVFIPTQEWTVFAKKIIQSGQSEILKDMDPEEVDEIFKEHVESLTPMTIIAIKAQVSGRDLFTHDGLDWKFTNPETLKSRQGIIRLNKGSSPILESKKGQLRFEFNLGPQFWQADRISKDICTEFEESRDCTVKLGEPSLELEKVIGYQRLTYLIMLYHAEVNGLSIARVDRRSRKKERKIRQLTRGIGEVLVDRIRNMKTEEHVGLPYQYTFKQEAIDAQDANSILYIRRWIETNDCSLIMVNLYKLMQQYLKNPHVTHFYPEVPPSPQEFKTQDAVHRLLFVDKFVHSDDLYGYKGNYVPKPKEDEQMSRVLQERLNTISQKVKNEVLNEKNAPGMKDWIINLIKNDYKKFRKSRDLSLQYLPGETYFSGREDIEYRPSYRRLGPQYLSQGFQKTSYNPDRTQEEDCEYETEEPAPSEEDCDYEEEGELPPPEYSQETEDDCEYETDEPPLSEEDCDYEEEGELPSPQYVVEPEDCSEYETEEPPPSEEDCDYEEEDE